MCSPREGGVSIQIPFSHPETPLRGGGRWGGATTMQCPGCDVSCVFRKEGSISVVFFKDARLGNVLFHKALLRCRSFA